MSILAFQSYPTLRNPAFHAFRLFDQKPKATRTGCGCQTCGCKNDLPAHVGRSPYSLHHADASRFKAVGELDLLEDHLINDPCPDCMNKHAMTASRFMSEAASLNGGEPGDVVGSDLIESARQCIKPESDIELARRVRDIRKVIQKKLKLSHAHGASDTHAHEGGGTHAPDDARGDAHEHVSTPDAAPDGAHVHDPSPLREPLVAGRYGIRKGRPNITQFVRTGTVADGAGSPWVMTPTKFALIAVATVAAMVIMSVINAKQVIEGKEFIPIGGHRL